ncbi:hypothetical protein [Candidatus Avelusimicrobium sp.]|uniref:hypothetical protein n=1 Tax=Candidatus Avelusimicrobium sp. TaxID=3048833 RepID=UPI003D7D50B2
MKRKNNELIFSFHQNIFNKFLGCLLVLEMITLTLCLFHSRGLLLVYILSMAVSIYVFTLIFFSPAVCKIYPDHIEWEQVEAETMEKSVQKYSLLWPNVKAFYLAERLVYCGRGNKLKTVLILVTGNFCSHKMQNFGFLSKKDREALLTELKARGVAELPFQAEDSAADLIKKFEEHFPH